MKKTTKPTRRKNKPAAAIPKGGLGKSSSEFRLQAASRGNRLKAELQTQAPASKVTSQTGSKKTPSPQADEAPRPRRSAFPIVGIGASAGGLEALALFLKNVPPTARGRPPTPRTPASASNSNSRPTSR